MKNIGYRGYEVAKGFCGGFGVFSEGHQISEGFDTVEGAKAKIDSIHSLLRDQLENGTEEYRDAAKEALIFLGELIPA